MKLTWRGPLLAVAGGAALILGAACGSDSETTTATPSTGGSTAAATAAPTEDPKAGWPEEIRLGFFGGDDAEEVLERVEPMRQYLEETLGVPVTIFTGTSYGAVIEAMRAKRVEGMLVGPFAYVLAVQEAGAEAIAVSVSCSSSEDPCQVVADRQPHYFSVVMAKKGSGIESIEDLRGKDFAFVDPASTSGHLAPKTLIIKNGVDPDVDMKTVFAGSHPTAVLALENDNVVAAATHENNLLNLIREGQVNGCFYEDGIANRGTPRTAEEIKKTYDACEDGKIVIIAQSDPIPNTPFAVRGDLPDTLKQAIKDALLAIKDDPEAVALDRRWFVDPTEQLGYDHLDQYYNSLRDIAKLLDLDLKELAES